MAFDSALDILLRLLAATVVGGLIGLNREFRHKSAGLRTHALVALGAAVVTALVARSIDGTGIVHFDAISRVIQGIITGIGFLGAGVILRTDNSQVIHGLTTAASIWRLLGHGLWSWRMDDHGRRVYIGYASSYRWWPHRKLDTQTIQARPR